EARAREDREIRVRRARIADAQGLAAFLRRRQRDHPLRDVDAAHPRAPSSEDARVVALPAPGVQHLLAAKIADEGEKRRIVQPLAGDVVALAYLVGPRV